MRFVIASALALMLVGSATAAVAEEVFQTEDYKVRIETVVDGLEHPWGMAFLPDGDILVTERDGRLRIVRDGRVLEEPVADLPEIWAKGQGGLLDVTLDPDFATTNRIFFSFSEPRGAGGATSVARARLVREGESARLEDLEVIFRQSKPTDSGYHFGSRVVFAPDGTLFVTLGERGDMDRAQDPMDHAGSIVRINKDGSIPADNPYADGEKALPEIWSTGHRNPQGADINPETGELWVIEHGAMGGDEVNVPEAGKNYGWPVISYGRHYSGAKIGVGHSAPGYEQPIHYWDPSIAPSGAAFYTGDLFPKWKNNLFVAALKFRLVARLALEGKEVVHEEWMFEEAYNDVRHIRTGPDGALWLLIDDNPAPILRVVPAE